eukprot:TRINITY_DN27149_c0_g1_i1.p1 TRINITY_DN27149_c0_g1~~TRINITY_DN27149_c0_g1_i1.p1  ORF type:complete len:137 (-),score=22.99 TRINITY_DN27149_c0_g1_i1:7-417(-)
MASDLFAASGSRGQGDRVLVAIECEVMSLGLCTLDRQGSQTEWARVATFGHVLDLESSITGQSLRYRACLLYTSDAADEEDSVDLGGSRIIKKKKKEEKRERIVTGNEEEMSKKNSKKQRERHKEHKVDREKEKMT